MKATLRKEFRARFAQLENKEERTAKLIEHLAQFLRTRSGDWCIYQALESEISLSSLLPKVPNVIWVYPKVMNGTLHFFEPTSARKCPGNFSA